MFKQICKLAKQYKKSHVALDPRTVMNLDQSVLIVNNIDEEKEAT